MLVYCLLNFWQNQTSNNPKPAPTAWAWSVGRWCSWSKFPRQPTSSTASTHTNMCKPAPPSSKDETITNGLSLEGVHVGTVNLMISSGTVILVLFAVFFYFYCKGRRGFCGPPSTSAPSPPAPANGFQQAMLMPGYFFVNSQLVEAPQKVKSNVTMQFILNTICCLRLEEWNIATGETS